MDFSFFDFTYKELKSVFDENKLPESGVDLLFRWHYKKRMTSPCVKDLAKVTQNYLNEKFNFTLPQIEKAHESEDGTIKFLLKLKDGYSVETVLIAFSNKYTLCLSTQVGCAMNCSFCFTGTQGLKRHLDTNEIIGQFILADNWIRTNKPNNNLLIKNIVYMGQGEPLHNFDAVKKSCEIFLDQRGFSIGIQKITISTAGYLPGLKRWIEEIPGVNLALSLHSTNTHKRNELIPINKKFPLHEVLEYIDSIPLARKQYIIYEYLLIKNFNDQSEDAHELGKTLSGKMAIINLIPFNPFPGSKYEKPSLDTIEQFQKIIESYSLPALIRGTKGDDILAACGQLNTK